MIATNSIRRRNIVLQEVQVSNMARGFEEGHHPLAHKAGHRVRRRQCQPCWIGMRIGILIACTAEVVKQATNFPLRVYKAV